jgi:hypothetical protein
MIFSVADGESKKKTVVEILLCYLPLILSAVLVLYPVLYWTSLDIRILLISAFPHAWRNFFTISVCLVIDMGIHVVSTIWGGFEVFMVISFVLTSIDTIKSGIEEIRQDL